MICYKSFPQDGILVPKLYNWIFAVMFPLYLSAQHFGEFDVNVHTDPP